MLFSRVDKSAEGRFCKMAEDEITDMNGTTYAVVEHFEEMNYDKCANSEGEESFFCRECGKNFSTAKGVKQHITTKHGKVRIEVKKIEENLRPSSRPRCCISLCRCCRSQNILYLWMKD